MKKIADKNSGFKTLSAYAGLTVAEFKNANSKAYNRAYVECRLKDIPIHYYWNLLGLVDGRRKRLPPAEQGFQDKPQALAGRNYQELSAKTKSLIQVFCDQHQVDLAYICQILKIKYP